MRAVIFSDIHMHNWAYGSHINEYGYNSRLWSQYEVLLQIYDYCRANPIDTLIFCGDLFHTHGKVDAAVLQLTGNGVEKFGSLGIPIIVLRGNHDTASRDGKIHSLEWLRAYKNINLVDDELITLKFEDIDALAYTEDKEKIEKFLSTVTENSLVLMHQGVAGAPLASGWVLDEILSPDMIPDRVNHCFTGHYHSHRRISDKLTIIGSTTHQTWADVGEDRGWIDYDTNTKEMTLIKSKAPEFKRIDFGSTYPQKEDSAHFTGKFIHACNFEGDPDVVKKELLSFGALAVELERPASKDEKVRLDTPKDFSIAPILFSFEQSIQDERKVIVGREIREGKYEISTI